MRGVARLAYASLGAMPRACVSGASARVLAQPSVRWFSSTAPGVEADEDLELEEGEEVGEDELQGQVFGQEDLEEEDEEWADDENNTTMFRMPEDEDGGDDDDRDTLVQEEQAKNSRYEFHPHVKPMDQFHIREVVRIGRHMKAMKGGRQMSFSALVLVGNGNGSAALGYGRGLKVMDAVNAANLDGEKNIVHIKRYEGTRNVATVVIRNKGCIVWKNALSGGSGVKGNYLVQMMCEAFGINAVSIKVIGPRSKNIVTRAKTIFTALLVQRDPEAEAKALGKMLFNPNKVWRRRPYTAIY